MWAKKEHRDLMIITEYLNLAPEINVKKYRNEYQRIHKMTASNSPPRPLPCSNVNRYKAAINNTEPKKSIFNTQKLDQKHILH